jgi:hypothetical protein
MCLQFGFVIFWQKDFATKAAHKMLVKLTPSGILCSKMPPFPTIHIEEILKKNLQSLEEIDNIQCNLARTDNLLQHSTAINRMPKS